MPAPLLAWSVVKESGFFTTGWLAFQVDVGKLNFLGFLHGFAHVIGKFDGIKHRFNFSLMIFEVVDGYRHASLIYPDNENGSSPSRMLVIAGQPGFVAVGYRVMCLPLKDPL